MAAQRAASKPPTTADRTAVAGMKRPRAPSEGSLPLFRSASSLSVFGGHSDMTSTWNEQARTWMPTCHQMSLEESIHNSGGYIHLPTHTVEIVERAEAALRQTFGALPPLVRIGGGTYGGVYSLRPHAPHFSATPASESATPLPPVAPPAVDVVLKYSRLADEGVCLPEDAIFEAAYWSSFAGHAVNCVRLAGATRQPLWREIVAFHSLRVNWADLGASKTPGPTLRPLLLAPVALHSRPNTLPGGEQREPARGPGAEMDAPPAAQALVAQVMTKATEDIATFAQRAERRRNEILQKEDEKAMRCNQTAHERHLGCFLFDLMTQLVASRTRGGGGLGVGSQALVHRDIKPGNVLLFPFPEAPCEGVDYDDGRDTGTPIAPAATPTTPGNPFPPGLPRLARTPRDPSESMASTPEAFSAALNEPPLALLADWGMGSLAAGSHLASAGEMATVTYRPPELLLQAHWRASRPGTADLGGSTDHAWVHDRIDVWSLGLMAFALLTHSVSGLHRTGINEWSALLVALRLTGTPLAPSASEVRATDGAWATAVQYAKRHRNEAVDGTFAAAVREVAEARWRQSRGRHNALRESPRWDAFWQYALCLGVLRRMPLFPPTVAFDLDAGGAGVSEDAADFCRRALTLDPHQRPSMTQLLVHPFLRRTVSPTRRAYLARRLAAGSSLSPTTAAVLSASCPGAAVPRAVPEDRVIAATAVPVTPCAELRFWFLVTLESLCALRDVEVDTPGMLVPAAMTTALRWTRRLWSDGGVRRLLSHAGVLRSQTARFADHSLLRQDLFATAAARTIAFEELFAAATLFAVCYRLVVSILGTGDATRCVRHVFYRRFAASLIPVHANACFPGSGGAEDERDAFSSQCYSWVKQHGYLDHGPFLEAHVVRVLSRDNCLSPRTDRSAALLVQQQLNLLASGVPGAPPPSHGEKVAWSSLAVYALVLLLVREVATTAMPSAGFEEDAANARRGALWAWASSLPALAETHRKPVGVAFSAALCRLLYEGVPAVTDLADETLATYVDYVAEQEWKWVQNMFGGVTLRPYLTVLTAVVQRAMFARNYFWRVDRERV